jgi:two-component system, cell cycle sensor histidine kinase and response regulator CckA
VLTDQTMPRLPGIDLARHIQQLRPGLPVILCTGYSSSAPPEMARSLGIREYLMKPVTRFDLAFAVRRSLDRQGAGARNMRPG